MVAPRRQLAVFFRLLTRVARRNNARYRIAPRSLVPMVLTPSFWEALWMGRMDELTLLDSYDAIGELIGWVGF